jgi:hypothetical protein
MEKKEEKQKTRPIHQLSTPCAGSVIRASIWRHQFKENARPRYSVSLLRSHPNKDGKHWTSDGFLKRDELFAAARLLESAHAWIVADDAAKEVAHG